MFLELTLHVMVLAHLKRSAEKKKLIAQFMIKLMNLTLGKAHLDMVF